MPPSRRSVAERDEFLRTARDRFRHGQDALSKQRKRELEDLAFYAGGEFQWDPDDLAARQAKGADPNTGLPPVPARPCITINKVREPVHQILNQERQSDMSVELAAADDFEALVGPLDETEIELREGLVRRIQRSSEAADARTWAFMRATIAGCGYYGVMTRFVKGKSWDKEIYIERYYNQACVTLDPAHEQPDGSDATWGMVGNDKTPWDEYKRLYPKLADGSRNRAVMASDSDFHGLGEAAPGWFVDEKNIKYVRVVNYWYTDYELRTLCLLADGSSAWEDELPDDLDADSIVDSREVVETKVKYAKIDGINILEEADWEGPDIPIVKVLGEELQPFDDDRRAEGMVRPAKGSGRGYNVMVSKLVENVGLTPIPPFQVFDFQIEGYENWYQVANSRALPFLPAHFKDASGTPYPSYPTRTNVETNIGAVVGAIQLFDEGVKATTLVPAVQLGHATDAHLKSGRAIQLMQDQAQLGTSNYLDNLKRSIRYEGQIVNNLLYPIYGKKPGRILKILTGEGETDHMQIGQNGAGAAPTGPLSGAGAPSPASGGMTAPAPMSPGNGNGRPPIKVATLTEHANFNVLVKVTRGFDSRRDEESTTIANLLQANPMFMTWFGDLFFKNQDGPGHEEMSERAKAMLDPKIAMMLAQKAQGVDMPPAVMAQMQQMQQRIQRAEQIMQGMAQELKSNQAELEAKVKIKQLENENRTLLRAMQDATSIEVARINAAKEHLNQLREDQEEELALQATHLHEAGQAELDRQHERDQAAQAHQNALAQGAAGVAGTMATQQQQADLQPPPEPSQPEQA